MYRNGCLYKKRLYCCFSLTFNSGPTERRLEKPAEEHSCVWEFSPGHFLIRDFPAHYTEAALLCKSQPTGTHQKHEFLMLWIWDWMAEMNHFFLIPLYIGNKIITSEMKISPAFQNKKQKRNKNNNNKKKQPSLLWRQWKPWRIYGAHAVVSVTVDGDKHQSLLNIKLAYELSYNCNSQLSQRMLSYMAGSKRQINMQACSFPDFLWFITQQILSATTRRWWMTANTRVKRREGQTILIVTSSLGQLHVTCKAPHILKEF